MNRLKKARVRKAWIKSEKVARGTKQEGHLWPPEAVQTAKPLKRYYRKGLRPELAYERTVKELNKNKRGKKEQR